MENYVSLMVFIIVFMTLLVLAAYVADVFACKLLRWLELEAIDNEYQGTPTIRFSNEDKALVEMAEGKSA